jgi:hypothetical protein
VAVTLLARTIFVALVATVGDFIWFEFGVSHTAWHGILHGAVLLLAVGLVLGHHAGALWRGALGGVFSGVAGALTFYAVAGGLGYLAALLTAWVFTWIVLAAVAAWLREELATVRRWILPGLAAAVASGVTFYLVSGIWTEHPDGGRNYLWHLMAWTLAWGPGVTLLTWKRVSTPLAT